LSGTVTAVIQSRTGLTVNGVERATPVYFDSNLRFDAPMVTTPTTPPMGNIGVSAPFTFGGTITAYANAVFVNGAFQFIGDPLFSATLLGQGIARAGLSRGFNGGSDRQFSVVEMSYDFTPAPTAEPATLALLASGIVGLAGYRRRQRRRR
jgi:hypothetical protein